MLIIKRTRIKTCPVCEKEISEREDYCCLRCEEKDKEPKKWYGKMLAFFVEITGG